MKKETLEEFINSQPYYGSCTTEYLEGIEEGAKWQQENSNINALDFEIDALKREIKVLRHQQERSYSEEEVLTMLLIKHDGLTPEYVLEQFKNK